MAKKKLSHEWKTYGESQLALHLPRYVDTPKKAFFLVEKAHEFFKAPCSCLIAWEHIAEGVCRLTGNCHDLNALGPIAEIMLYAQQPSPNTPIFCDYEMTAEDEAALECAERVLKKQC